MQAKKKKKRQHVCQHTCILVLNFDFQILSGLVRPREQGIEDPAAVRAPVGSVQGGEAGQSRDGSSEVGEAYGKAGPGRPSWAGWVY